MPIFLVACWGVPFFGLLPAGAKRRPIAVAAASASVLLGLLAERLLLVLPAAPVGAAVLALEFLLMAGAGFVASSGTDERGGAAAQDAAGPAGGA